MSPDADQLAARGRETAENARWAATHIMDQLEKRDEDGRQTAEAIFSYTAVADGCVLMAGPPSPAALKVGPEMTVENKGTNADPDTRAQVRRDHRGDWAAAQNPAPRGTTQGHLDRLGGDAEVARYQQDAGAIGVHPGGLSRDHGDRGRLQLWRTDTNSALSRRRRDGGYAENSIADDAKNP